LRSPPQEPRQIGIDENELRADLIRLQGASCFGGIPSEPVTASFERRARRPVSSTGVARVPVSERAARSPAHRSVIVLPVSDELTQRVAAMYARFPYPSSSDHALKLKELRNLLTIFSLENRYPLAGTSILDAGTGTGHRLIEAASAFAETQFVAFDVSDIPLQIARDVAAREGLRNIEFRPFDLMDDRVTVGQFDIALAMGVIHHLSDPARGLRNLVRNIHADGLVFIYVYGLRGGRERRRRKQIVSLLLGEDQDSFETGIALVRELGFDTFDYGWNLGVEGDSSQDALIVDAYLNVNETLFEIDSIFELLSGSGLHSFMTYGVTLEQQGYLFDTRLDPGSTAPARTTDVAAQLPSATARAAYERLSLRDRYRLADLLFEPNGYTLLGLSAGAIRRLPPDGRVLANALPIAAPE
jgi:2-polyprenyl-3-methyl-5-hydroxy-6-metoxy-1,4-benzoquinol methylase